MLSAKFELLIFITCVSLSIVNVLSSLVRGYSYEEIVDGFPLGLNLSCNKLIIEIPPQIGNLTRIQILNLSHNN